MGSKDRKDEGLTSRQIAHLEFVKWNEERSGRPDRHGVRFYLRALLPDRRKGKGLRDYLGQFYNDED